MWELIEIDLIDAAQKCAAWEVENDMELIKRLIELHEKHST